MKPVTFFDLESTSADRNSAKIVEIALVRINLDGTRDQFQSLVNPEIPIPPEATAIHQITDEAVKDAPTLKSLIPIISSAIEGCDIGGFNSNNYDIPLLYKELADCGYTWDLTDVSFIDPCVVFKRKEERTLSAAVQFYCNREHIGAHGALADVNATIDVFIEQLKKYPDIQSFDRQQLNLFCNYDKARADLAGCFTIDENGEYIINFGKKHKGQKAKDCRDYLMWMLTSDFMSDTKALINKILKPQ